MNRILLISGKAGSGKDTIGNHIVNTYKYTRLAFADELKNFVSNKYNVNYNLMFSQEGKKRCIVVNNKEMTIRDLLIHEGMVQRKKSPTFWVDLVIQKIILYDIKNVVITDFRFPNEFEKLVEKFSNINTIRIIRDNIDEINSISENSLDEFKFDNYIYNNSSINELYNRFDNKYII